MIYKLHYMYIVCGHCNKVCNYFIYTVDNDESSGDFSGGNLIDKYEINDATEDDVTYWYEPYCTITSFNTHSINYVTICYVAIAKFCTL